MWSLLLLIMYKLSDKISNINTTANLFTKIVCFYPLHSPIWCQRQSRQIEPERVESLLSSVLDVFASATSTGIFQLIRRQMKVHLIGSISSDVHRCLTPPSIVAPVHTSQHFYQIVHQLNNQTWQNCKNSSSSITLFDFFTQKSLIIFKWEQLLINSFF